MNPQAQPATIYNEITDQINDLLRDNGRFLKESDLAIRALTAKCDQLVKIDAIRGWITYARIAQLCGNEERFRYCIRNASRLDPSEEWEGTNAVGLMNLGHFSESAVIFSKLVDPRTGNFSAIYPGALCSGAFFRVLECYNALPSMGIDMPSDFPLHIVEAAVETMRSAQVSDEAVSKFLDMAGKVLRDHKCMHAVGGPTAEITEVDASPILHLKFRLNLDPNEIADANFDLACLVAEAHASIPPNVHISFGSDR
ncbi:hypothetical protein G5B35_14910 [Parapusillimonas sp. SGNA-6]|nr:hypothetical protein [Parapusillimonas sp. SGNA-6]